MAADIESARLAPLAGVAFEEFRSTLNTPLVAFEEFRSTLNTPLPESTHGLLAREETAGMTIRFSGPPSLPWRPIAVLGSDAWASRAGWSSGCRSQAELCNGYCTLDRGSLAGLLAREETAGMTIRFSGPPSLPWRPIAVLGSDAWASRAGWPSGCRLQAELCNSYCTLDRGSLAQSWQMGLSSFGFRRMGESGRMAIRL